MHDILRRLRNFKQFPQGGCHGDCPTKKLTMQCLAQEAQDGDHNSYLILQGSCMLGQISQEVLQEDCANPSWGFKSTPWEPQAGHQHLQR